MVLGRVHCAILLLERRRVLSGRHIFVHAAGGALQHLRRVEYAGRILVVRIGRLELVQLMLQACHVLVVCNQELVEAIVVHRAWGHLNGFTARVGHTGGGHRVMPLGRALCAVLRHVARNQADVRYLMSAGG